jgi:hypothetical protein
MGIADKVSNRNEVAHKLLDFIIGDRRIFGPLKLHGLDRTRANNRLDNLTNQLCDQIGRDKTIPHHSNPQHAKATCQP